MRVFSFAQESTRFCNYSKDKFGKECTFIIPCWTQLKEGEYELFEEDESLEGLDCVNASDNNSYVTDPAEKAFLRVLDTAERDYFNLLKKGWIAQQARSVLPNALKTELVMTGTTEQWEGFFKLRDDEKHAHPQAYELAHPLHEEFKRRGLCTS